MDALLNAPDQSTDQGRRDHALLLFLYNTGTRADEAAQAKSLISHWHVLPATILSFRCAVRAISFDAALYGRRP